MLVDRIPYLVGGTLRNMGRTPDIVEWQTVLWDTKVRYVIASPLDCLFEPV